MEFSGLALWADNASERPSWVSGTWRVDGGVIHRVGEEHAAPSVGFIVPGMVDSHAGAGTRDARERRDRRARLRCPGR